MTPPQPPPPEEEQQQGVSLKRRQQALALLFPKQQQQQQEERNNDNDEEEQQQQQQPGVMLSYTTTQQRRTVADATTTTTTTTNAAASTAPDNKNNNNNDECMICLETVTLDGVWGSCGHLYHYDCIMEWMDCRDDCPTCRQRLFAQEALAQCLANIKQQEDAAATLENSTTTAAQTTPDPTTTTTTTTTRVFGRQPFQQQQQDNPDDCERFDHDDKLTAAMLVSINTILTVTVLIFARRPGMALYLVLTGLLFVWAAGALLATRHDSKECRNMCISLFAAIAGFLFVAALVTQRRN